MNATAKSDPYDSGDIETGAIDSGLEVNTVVHKPANAAAKASAKEDGGDPKSEINYYGIGVNKMDN